ncbi:MAG: ATP-binding protein [Betaproteobacteria bacterium]
MLIGLLVAVAAAEAVAIAVLVRRNAAAAERAARWAVTAQVTGVLAESLDVEAVLPDAIRLFVPTFADWCALHLVDDQGPRRAALVHADPEMERELVRRFSEFQFDPEGASGPARVIRSGKGELAGPMTPEILARQAPHLRELAKFVDLCSWVTVPLKARQATVGAFTLARSRRRAPFEEDDMAWAQDVGHRIGLALENARLYAEARDLFEQTISANFVSTPDGRVLACNRPFAELLGLGSVEEALNAPASSFYTDAAERERFLNALRVNRRLTGFELTIRRRDGQPLTVSENVVGTFNDRGELVKLTGFIVDRTAERALDQRLQQAQRLEAIGQLAGGIAHDFNNLLTVIIGCSELLQLERAAPPAASGDPLEELRKAAQHAATLTHQLLAFSRRQVLQPRTLDVNGALRGIHSMLRRLTRENIVLVLDLDPGIPQVRVDPGQLDQVIVNLVINAGDAMPDGGTVTLSTGNRILTAADRGEHAYVQPGRYVSITVRDTGVGMDEATCARAFEPFFTTKPVGKGTGLGLSTVYGIVKQSGGFVWLTSASGQGTAATVCLPIVPPEE